MKTKDIIDSIVLNRDDVSELSIIKLGESKDLKADSPFWSLTDDRIFQRALSLRKDLGIPFWSAIMTSMVSLNKFSENCLNQISRHNPNEIIQTIKAEDFINTKVGEKQGINSKVIMKDGSVRHIPMLDFRVRCTDENTVIVKYICKQLLPNNHGFILVSGNSYHLIGNVLMYYDELVVFLGKALLYSPIVDDIWIAHQLIEGSCTLRLSRKHGVYPTLIEEV